MSKEIRERDNALIKRYLAGDVQAFGELYLHYEEYFKRYIRQNFIGLDADDLLQDAMLKVMKALPTFKFESRFPTWAVTVIRNYARDIYRQRQRRPNSVELQDYLFIPKLDETITDNENVKSLRRILDEFSETIEDKYKAVLSCLMYGLDIRETADLLKINYNTARWQKYTLICKLKEYFEKVGYDYQR